MFHYRKGLAGDWERIATEHLGAWSTFRTAERAEMADIGDWLLRHKHWEAANGFALNDDILTTIALEAALLVLELDTDYYGEVGTIIVYPTTIISRGTFAGPVPGTVTAGSVTVSGQAHDQRGAILIAWDDARDAARHPGHGRNVVFHEFAHKLDMLDDLIDGTPPLETDAQLTRWVEVCTEAYEALHRGDPRPPLDEYGGESPAEFFAVATEAFFDVPLALELHEPAVFEVLRDFYRQDPARRVRPGSRATDV